MKYIILLLCLCACKQNHEAKKADQRRLESWTVRDTSSFIWQIDGQPRSTIIDLDSTRKYGRIYEKGYRGYDSHYIHSNDKLDTGGWWIKIHPNVETRKMPSNWGDTNSNVWNADGEWLRTFSIHYKDERLWSVTLHKDTATIMSTGADSIFIKAKVIVVAGEVFKIVD